MKVWSSPRSRPDLGDRPQRRHALRVDLRRAAEHVLGDDLEHPPGPGELGAHLGVGRHGRTVAGRPSWTTDIPDCYCPRYADERRRRVGDPLLHGPRRPARGPGAARGPAGRVPRRAARLPGQGTCRRRPRPGSPSRGPGPRGGYRLARPPAEITLLDVVLAVDGDEHGVPVPRDPPARARRPPTTPGAYRRPCGIARAMWRAEDAWRAELAATTDRRPGRRAPRHRRPPRSWCRGAEWIQEVEINEEEPSMKIFLAGGTGVVGTRALPALVAAGHEVTAVARTDAKAELVRSLGRRRRSRSTCSTPTAVAAAVVGHEAVVNLATSIPPLHQGGPRLGLGHQRAAAHRGVQPPGRRRPRTPGPPATCRSRSASRTSTTATVDRRGPPGRPRRARSPAPATPRPPRARFADGGRRRGRAAVRPVLRPGQQPHAGLQRRRPRAGSTRSSAPPEAYTSFIHAEDAGSAVVAALARADAAPTTSPTTSRSPAPRRARSSAEALGVKPPHDGARSCVQAATPRVGQAAHALAAGVEPPVQGRPPAGRRPTRRSAGRGRA